MNRLEDLKVNEDFLEGINEDMCDLSLSLPDCDYLELVGRASIITG